MVPDVYNIMILDPLKHTRGITEKTLKSLGHNVNAFSNSKRLIHALEEQTVDLCLIECRLNELGLDGFRVSKLVLQHNKDVAIIMTSEHPTRDQVISAIRAGAVDFVVKPANKSELAKKTKNSLIRVGRIPPEAGTSLESNLFSANMTPPEKLEILMKKINKLMALPHAVMKIFQVYARQDTGAADMTKAVESDPGIAAMVLKRSNSSYYGKTANGITDVKAAIVRIGFRETRNMVATMSVFKLFSTKQKSFGFNRVWYWLHSLGTGTIAEYLAEQSGTADSGTCFMAGLLHDLGKIIIDDYLPDDYQQAVRQAAIENVPLREAETGVFSRNHTEVGAHVMRQWKFPESMIEPVRFHHNQEKCFDAEKMQRPDMFPIIHLANGIAKCLLIGSGGDFLIQQPPAAIWSKFKLNQGITRKVLEQIHKTVSDFLEFLSITAKDIGKPAIGVGTGAGEAYYVDPDEERMGYIQIYLANLGYESKVVSKLADVEAGETPILIRAKDEESLGDLLEEAQSADQMGDRKVAIICDAYCEELPPSINENFKTFCFPLDIFSLHTFLNDIDQEEEEDAEEDKEAPPDHEAHKE